MNQTTISMVAGNLDALRQSPCQGEMSFIKEASFPLPFGIYADNLGFIYSKPQMIASGNIIDNKLQQRKDCPIYHCKNQRSSAPTGSTHRLWMEKVEERILQALAHPHQQIPQIQ